MSKASRNKTTKRQEEKLQDVDVDDRSAASWKLPEAVSVTGDDVEPGPPLVSSSSRSVSARTSIVRKDTRSNQKALTEHSGSTHRRRFIIWGSIGAALLAAIVLALLFLVGPLGSTSSSSPSDPKVENDSNFTMTPREAALISIMAVVSPIGLNDEGSAQYLAKEWLFHFDLLQLTPSATTSNDTIIQRYVLAVFYYATNGPKSWAANNWLAGGECVNLYWTGISCNDYHQVRAIAFGRFLCCSFLK